MSLTSQPYAPVAGWYDDARPPYALSALRWALGDEPRTVVDLGAGTGILSRQLAALGHRVIAVEPDEAMRARIGAAGGVAQVLGGSAEQIPLPDGSADAVLAGQAYHWFAPERAHPEIARVLRPGGVFAPLWNARQVVPGSWVETFGQIMAVEGHSSGYRIPRELSLPDLFEQPRRAAFRHDVAYTGRGLIRLVRSRSWFAAISCRRQHEVERQVEELVHSHPELAGRESFAMPYATVIFAAHRNGENPGAEEAGHSPVC